MSKAKSNAALITGNFTEASKPPGMESSLPKERKKKRKAKAETKAKAHRERESKEKKENERDVIKKQKMDLDRKIEFLKKELVSDAFLLSRAYKRQGTAYVMMAETSKDYKPAIEAFQKAGTAHRRSDTPFMLNRAKRAMEQLAEKEHFGHVYTRKNKNLSEAEVMANDKGTQASDSTNGKGLRGKLNKVVLAYSGGLDTSVIVPWLRENYGCEVVCFTANVGQGLSELEGLEAKAKASGACQLVVKDLTEEFVKDYVYPCLRAGAVYERKYLLGTSMARPVIAKAMVDVAREVGADAVAHGCTGKGNDQVRFELTFFALNPDLQVVVPWREWDITGREDAIEYAKKHNVPVPVTKKSIYSRDRNLWHLSHEGDILEDPANEAKKGMYMMSVDPEDAPDKPEYLEIGISSGIPVSIDGVDLSPASLLSKLNDIGGRHGIGRIDMVENRLVGMKSRGVYETPGGTILAVACRELESLTLDREAIQFKDTMALKYAELVYAGRWFDPLRESMDAFMENITKTTTGSVRLKLYKGSVIVASRKSPNSLYREDISSFESGQIYNQADAAGFIRLYGLPMRVRAMLEKEQAKK